MSELIHRIVKLDGSIEDRPFTSEELALFQKDAADLERENQKQADAITKRQTALAKLEALGLDVDDLKALGF